MPQVRSLQGDTVDLICWRAFGATAAVTEQVLELNRNLTCAAAILPTGTLVALPDVAPPVAEPLVQLWD